MDKLKSVNIKVTPSMKKVIDSYQGKDVQGYAEMMFSALISHACIQVQTGHIQIVPLDDKSFQMTSGAISQTINLVAEN